MLHIYKADLTDEVKASIIKALETILEQGDVRKYFFCQHLFVASSLCIYYIYVYIFVRFHICNRELESS